MTGVPYHSPYVSDATRELAADWFERCREMCAEMGLVWTEPDIAVETDAGWIEYEWRNNIGGRKHFSVAVEVTEDGKEEIEYQRVDDDEAADMPDGDASHTDSFRLLWYWLWH